MRCETAVSFEIHESGCNKYLKQNSTTTLFRYNDHHIYFSVIMQHRMIVGLKYFSNISTFISAKETTFVSCDEPLSDGLASMVYDKGIARKR
jgi:hypothetical protein